MSYQQSPSRPPEPEETGKIGWATENDAGSGSGTRADPRGVGRHGPVLAFRYHDPGSHTTGNPTRTDLSLAWTSASLVSGCP